MQNAKILHMYPCIYSTTQNYYIVEIWVGGGMIKEQSTQIAYIAHLIILLLLKSNYT